MSLAISTWAKRTWALYKYGAEPGDSTSSRVTVDLVGSSTGLVADLEGLAIYHRPDGIGYLLASSQGNNRFNVYRREGNNAYLGTFQIANGLFGSAVDTDGIDVINMSLGPLYPTGPVRRAEQRPRLQVRAVGRHRHAVGAGGSHDRVGRASDSCADVASVSVSPSEATVEVGATPGRGGCILLGSAFLSPAAASPNSRAARPQPHQSLEYPMFVLIGAALAIGVSVVTLLYTVGRRSGLFDLGTVSAQWLAEYREYQEGGRSR